MKFLFIARMPDAPGSLEKAAEIAKMYHANIHRIHYNRRIDPETVFFEITASESYYDNIKRDLEDLGYLQTSLKPVSFLKLKVYIPHQAGALFEFLNFITLSGANIGFMDFDDSSQNPDELTVSLTLEETDNVNKLLNLLKSNYRLEILEYQENYDELDDTVFYINFAQKLRSLIGYTEEKFLMKLLNDVNHIVQELTRSGKDPKEIFNSILLTGETLKNTTGYNFYANVQKIRLNKDIELFCFQPPCGGNIFFLNTPEKMVMVDTGFGLYYPDILKMFQKYGLGDLGKLDKIYLTHADADHCGAVGFYKGQTFMHLGTLDAIEKSNRAYGSSSQNSILEEVYTKLINLFSQFNPPKKVEIFSGEIQGMRGVFPIIHKFELNGATFEVLESLGGHLYGQIFILSLEYGLIFTGDSLINFESLTEERKKFNILAKNLMNTVNVDKKAANLERESLINLAEELNQQLAKKNKKCLICGGHGAVSVYDDHKLHEYGHNGFYRP